MEGLKLPEQLVFGLDIGTRSIVGTVGYKQNARDFVVAAQTIKFHETRAMMDGQIHDIGRVAESIGIVKRDLEKQLGRRLNDVCIAAAGRVLKTITVKTEYSPGDDIAITEEMIRSMELIGVEEAHRKLREMNADENADYYCVGYSVVRYYLGDVTITNLEGHRGNRIGAEVLATFLPEDVIDGLYAATDRAGLTVVNLTLEPIAAINLAIPEKFRLLNLALVDVGAGTSDICITKDGSVTSYGMIPCAGDFITEKLMKDYLVEFSVAENMKLALSKKKKKITYTDIMGLRHTVLPEELGRSIAEPLDILTKQIADKINELNGGKQVSAVFIVGGGGKNPDFTGMLAKHMSLNKDRVALRGEEVLKQVHFPDEKFKKDPSLVTPIGICLNYYEQSNNFIFVVVNDERIKLYDNSRLTCMDAALGIGFPNEKLFPRRGRGLNFTVDGKRRMIRGGAGESAIITINGKPASISSPIMQNDIIKITESTVGEPAGYTVGQIPEYSTKIVFTVNNQKVVCPRFARVGDRLVSEFYEIQEGDDIELLNHYTVRQLLEFMDVNRNGSILVNNIVATEEEKVYENFTVEFGISEAEADVIPDEAVRAVADDPDEGETVRKSDGGGKSPTDSAAINVTVNGSTVTMTGKTDYLFVDVLDYYSFDTSQSHGSQVVMRANGEKADFLTPVNDGTVIELYWEE